LTFSPNPAKISNQDLKQTKLMYWIYFIIFTLIVFIPSFISKGILGLSIIQTQEYAILFMGILGFALFTILERRLKKDEKEKNKMIGQISRTNKDLTHSYSYIGEMNRKLDILMNITLGFPESSNITAKKQRKLYESIMEAIQLFGRADEFIIRFTNLVTGEILKEIKSSSNINFNFAQKNCDSKLSIFENEHFIAIPSPKTMDDIYACIILKKKNSQQNNNDFETMRVLAMQSLSLFMLINNKKGPHKHTKASA
jgi:hypothetical protein